MGVKGKLRTTPDGHAAYCPGCKEYHVIPDRWHFDGNYEAPSFSPSLLLTDGDRVCHSFITNGEWRYLSDCTHELKGKAVRLRTEG